MGALLADRREDGASTLRRLARRILCSPVSRFLAGLAVSGLAGLALAQYCISELAAIFGSQALLLLLWSCFRRPRAEITWCYIVVCSGVLVRETVLIVTGGVPCGYATESNCQETICKEQNHILWLATSCRRRECVLRFPTEEVGWVRTFFVRPEEVHTTWLVSATVCVWAAVLLSILQMLRWQFAARRQQDGASCGSPRHRGRLDSNGHMHHDSSSVAQPVALILAVPVTYGLCALHSLRVLTTNRDQAWSAEAMLDAAELYSSLALYAFQRLLVLYVDTGMLPGLHVGNSIVIDVTAVEGEALELRRRLQQLVAVGIKQYVFITFWMNTFEVSARCWDWWYPSSCASALSRVATMWFPHHNISITLDDDRSRNRHPGDGSAACADLWNVASLLMVVADFFTCSIALFAIWTYERSFSVFFHPMKPFWKFWGVKGLLTVGWLQATFLVFLGLVAENTSLSDENFRTFLNFFLVCVEAFLLACLNIFAYPPIILPYTVPCGRSQFSSFDMGGGADSVAGLEELDVVDVQVTSFAGGGSSRFDVGKPPGPPDGGGPARTVLGADSSAL